MLPLKPNLLSISLLRKVKMVRNILAPGLRFRPTEVELVCYYLKRKNMGLPIPHEAIADVKLYEFSPWDLPALSCLPSRDLEWYFFYRLERRYSHGNRTNRATKAGFWKATGNDRPVLNNSKKVGMITTLVYYTGKPQKFDSTDWIMHEFRLESEELVKEGYTQAVHLSYPDKFDAYVICKLFKKIGKQFKKSGKQSAAPFIEEEWEGDDNFDYPSFFASSAPPQTTPTDYVRSSFEVGEPSSRQEPTHEQIVSETTTLQPYGIGESSTQNHSEIVAENSRAGEQHEQPQVGNPCALPHSYADGMSMDQVENYLLNSAPTETMEEPGIRLDDIIQCPYSDDENVYANLEELCRIPTLDQYDGVGYNPMVHNGPLMLSLCEKDTCMFIDDILIDSSFSIYGDGNDNNVNAGDEKEPLGPSADWNPSPSSSEYLLQKDVP